MAGEIRREILRLFHERPEDYISGAEISQSLGVSRTAVWKHIRQLRDAGYAIEAVTSRGYRLETAPDLLLAADIQAGLACKRIGRDMVCLESTDSTNLRALELAEQGGTDGTVLIAEEQTGGKGRLGRRWESPRGVNLYASLLLRPAIAPFVAPQLTFVAALAVVEAIAETTSLSANVKWPNDVLLNGCKVSGILSEMRAESDRVHYVILGVGVNLNMTRKQFPSELRYPATSLLIESGQTVPRSAFVRSFLQRFEAHYDAFLAEGFDAVRPAWDACCAMVGQRVRVEQEPHTIVGEVVGLDEDGSLLVRDDHGKLQNIYAGDVFPE
ncbi:MAG: biotin--[acetyl-CoA-carboxylase] ligase [Desulfuromonas sp.]|nr:MAG: biotin--[acetyl-CoA-carboxylase] ligase [Desulfuromonas sp.]